MLEVLAVVVGVLAVLSVLTDMINTLVTTQTSSWKWWLSRRLAEVTWQVVRTIACRLPQGALRERLLATLAPILVLMMLVAWVAQQILGFGLIWWGLGGVSGVESLLDSIYYSGVVFFTVGFGEVVPSGTVPRFGALLEAFSGVLTTALVIGYLPALYGAYSERERKLMTLDDGSDDRITPINLIKAWAPDASPQELVGHFEPWEEWVASILETHTSFPMLRLFRSHHEGQNWITALGVLADAGLHCQMIEGAQDRAPYFVVRRVIRLFDDLTAGVDLSQYRVELDAQYGGPSSYLEEMLRELKGHGFKVVSEEEADRRMRELRPQFDAQMEYLIDSLLAPRGFWGHAIGHRIQESGVTGPDGALTQERSEGSMADTRLDS